jgi:trimeric autotransporter adhesin
MKLRAARVVVGFLSLVLSLVQLTFAQTPTQTASALPRLVRFGGTVKDLNGNPLTGVVGITFALYSEQTGGAALWLETQNVSADSNGRYTALLGSTKPDGLPTDLFTSEQARWVGAQVSGQVEQPRILLVSVPYALKAGDAQTLGGRPASDFAVATTPLPSSALASGNGAAAVPTTMIAAAKQTKAGRDSTVRSQAVTNSGPTNFSGNTANQIVAVSQTGSGIGLKATAPSNIAIEGITTATSGTTYGVYAQSASTSGIGVQGITTAKSGGTGVTGFSSATSGPGLGVLGQSASTAGVGVKAFTTATSGTTYGVYAQSASTSGVGVQGVATATSGFTDGVAGVNASPHGVGVLGTNTAPGGTGMYGAATDASTTANIGVQGISSSAFGTGVVGAGASFGVVGTARNGVAGTAGVFGQATSVTGQVTGVLGESASASGIAGLFNNTGGGDILVGRSAGVNKFTVDGSGNGFFAGNLAVTGHLTKGSGSFKIDHPVDPANKYLSHSFVESPDMMDVYNGVVRLDAKGEAWVSLPGYFEALNRDFRYQLTSIGAPAPNLYVAREVSRNHFEIAGGKSRGKVSWQVTGIRQDAYANRNRIPVEEEKPLSEHGYYLHPEVFGQPASKSLDAARKLAPLAPVNDGVAANAAQK